MKVLKVIEETNRDRLKILVKEYRTEKALAEVIEKSDSQVSQWVNGSGYSKPGKGKVSGKGRAMSATTKRHIEGKTNKPIGWLDQPVESSYTNDWFTEADITTLRLFKELPEDKREFFRTLIELWIKESKSQSSIANDEVWNGVERRMNGPLQIKA